MLSQEVKRSNAEKKASIKHKYHVLISKQENNERGKVFVFQRWDQMPSAMTHTHKQSQFVTFSPSQPHCFPDTLSVSLQTLLLLTISSNRACLFHRPQYASCSSAVTIRSNVISQWGNGCEYVGE